MPGSTRGSDLNSWWQNRAARRQEIAQAVAPLRDAQSRLSRAAGTSRPASVTTTPTDSADDLVRQANATLSAFSSLSAQAPRLVEAAREEQSALDAVKAAVERSSGLRARGQAEEEANKAYQTRVAAAKAGLALRKVCALVIFLVVLGVLYKY
jgi:hypothetical protein